MITYKELSKIEQIENLLTISKCIHIAKEDFYMFSEEHLKFIVQSIANVFEVNFGIRVNFEVRIVNQRSIEDLPETLRNQGVINLAINEYDPCRFVYQLAHEMCHYYYFYVFDIPQKFRWFEETICELVSELTLNILSKSWTGIKLFGMVSNNEVLKNYLQKITITNAKNLNGEQLKYNTLENHLERECYDRAVNTFFALKIFNSVKDTSLKSFFNDLRVFMHQFIINIDKGFIDNISVSSNRIKRVFGKIFIQDSYLYKVG